MKLEFKRCLLLILCALFLPSLLVSKAYAYYELPIEGEHWNQLWICPEETLSEPNVIIIYLHGDNLTGRNLDALENMAYHDHPLKYARNDTLILPDDAIFICPEAQYDGQFRTEKEHLEEFIEEIDTIYPDAKIILSGASHGCLATYKIAASLNKYVDGYVFISGVRPGESDEISTLRNCLVVFADEPWLSKRNNYSILFQDADITESRFTKEITYWETDTNNAYVRGPWNHSNSPLIFTEDFFWEWVTSISTE